MIAPCDTQELSVQPAPATQPLSGPDAATALSRVWPAGSPMTVLICQVAVDAAPGVKLIAPVSVSAAAGTRPRNKKRRTMPFPPSPGATRTAHQPKAAYLAGSCAYR